MLPAFLRPRRALCVAALGSTILASGCAVGPDFEKPSAPKDAAYAPAGSEVKLVTDATANGRNGGVAQTFNSGGDVRFDWWAHFESPALNQLVERALKQNPSITTAQASLRQAQELASAQTGQFLPQIGAGYSFARQQQNNVQSSSGTTSTFNLHTTQLTVGFVPDVFGLNRRTVESLDAQAENARFLLDAAYVTLINNVVAAAVQEGSTRDQIKAAKSLIESNQKMVDILHAQQKLGAAMDIDVATAEASLAQSQQLLPPLEKQLAQTRDLIRALVGNLPNQDVVEIPSLAALKLPADLPLSLPSDIVKQRPDVRAAEEAVRSANAQVGVAIANRLPQFNITGGVGGSAYQFADMFKSGGPFWNLAAGVTQPIFDGNTLLHRERAADQALIQASEQYRATVITAYQNVADTLQAISSDATAYQRAVANNAAARHILDVTTAQNRLGAVDWLTLYTANISFQQSELNVVQAEATRYTDTAALFQALGGGWWNRPDRDKDNTKGDILIDPLKTALR